MLCKKHHGGKRCTNIQRCFHSVQIQHNVPLSWVLFQRRPRVSPEMMSCQTKFSCCLINELLVRYFPSKNTPPGGRCDEPWRSQMFFYLCLENRGGQVHTLRSVLILLLISVCESKGHRPSLIGPECLKAGAAWRKITGCRATCGHTGSVCPPSTSGRAGGKNDPSSHTFILLLHSCCTRQPDGPERCAGVMFSSWRCFSITQRKD